MGGYENSVFFKKIKKRIDALTGYAAVFNRSRNIREFYSDLLTSLSETGRLLKRSPRRLLGRFPGKKKRLARPRKPRRGARAGTLHSDVRVDEG